MRSIVLAAALCASLAAYAQPAHDPNTRGANTEGSALDPETKARARTEGATGGIQGGQKTEEQKEGAAAGSSPGRATRSRRGLEGDERGRVHNETSSDREEGRGARGAIR